jgi:hypothetical protein
VGTVAFVLLGVVTAVGWARRRDRSLGFLALAIVLLSLVSPLGSIPQAYAPPLLPQITLLVFIGSGYALGAVALLSQLRAVLDRRAVEA